MPPLASIRSDQFGVEPPDVEPPDIEPLDEAPPRLRERLRPEPLVVVELSGIDALPLDMPSPDIEPLAVPPFDMVPPDIVPPPLMSPDVLVPEPGIELDGEVEGIDVPIEPPADELDVVPPPAGGWEIAAAGNRAIAAAIRIVRMIEHPSSIYTVNAAAGE